MVTEIQLPNVSGPHQGESVICTGAPLASAAQALIMIHGRGASPYDMLGLAEVLNPANTAILAPQASGNTWYPYRFLEPLSKNEPYLTSALSVVGALVDYVSAQNAALTPEHIFLLGFSQGACLVLEFAARHARRYAGVFGLSGALIGPKGTPRDYPGSLAETPVFLGCSDIDPHIPVECVHESTAVFEQLGGKVTKRIYPRMGHAVNDDEVAFIQQVMQG